MLNSEDCKASIRECLGRPEARALVNELLQIERSLGPLDPCALQRHEGRRSLASSILTILRSETSDGPDHSTDSDASSAKPGPKSGAGNARRSTRKRRFDDTSDTATRDA